MKRATAFILILALLLCTPVAASAAQTVVTAVVPELYSLTVARADNIQVTLEGNRVDGGIVNVGFATQPKLLIRPASGYTVGVLLLNGEDVTDQLKGGYLTLPPVYEDMTLVAAARAVTDPTSGSYTVKGRVLQDGKPVSGVMVEISARSGAVRTNRNGEFSFTKVPAGSHSLTVLKDGKVIGHAVVEVEEGDEFTYRIQEDGSYLITVPDNIVTLNMDVHVEEDGSLRLNKVRGETRPTYNLGWNDNPPTGDRILAAVAVMALSGAALVFLLLLLKKRRKDDSGEEA